MTEDINETKIIGDHTYQIEKAKCDDSVQAFIRLFKTVGPALSDLLPALATGKKVDLLSLDLGAVSGGLRTLAMTLAYEDLSYVADRLLKNASVDDKPLTLNVRNEHFRGKSHEYLQLVWFAIEVNYTGFLGGLVGSLQGKKTAR